METERNKTFQTYIPLASEKKFDAGAECVFVVHSKGVMSACEEFFPTSNAENLVIALSGVGVSADFSCLISSRLKDLELMETFQCFPLHWYDGNGKVHDGISDYVLEKVHEKLEYAEKSNMNCRSGTSSDTMHHAAPECNCKPSRHCIFYYIYGLLHHPKYREAFAEELKKSLPRIPLTSDIETFWVLARAGRQLAELHLSYEDIEPSLEVLINGMPFMDWRFHVTTGEWLWPGNSGSYTVAVTKMKFPSDAGVSKDTIIFNPHITISNIPENAYKYIINGKSVIEWVMEYFQVKTDKDGNITSDPNLSAQELGRPDYILNLLLSLIALSAETMDIIEGLPNISFR